MLYYGKSLACAWKSHIIPDGVLLHYITRPSKTSPAKYRTIGHQDANEVLGSSLALFGNQKYWYPTDYFLTCVVLAINRKLN